MLTRSERPLSGCTGRALFAYLLAKTASSDFEISMGVFSTNQDTSSLQGGVVSEPVKA